MPGADEAGHGGDIEQTITVRNERDNFAARDWRLRARGTREALDCATELEERDAKRDAIRLSGKHGVSVRRIVFEVVVDECRQRERRGSLSANRCRSVHHDEDVNEVSREGAGDVYVGVELGARAWWLCSPWPVTGRDDERQGSRSLPRIEARRPPDAIV